jgi:hypothetical protein
MLVMGHVAFFSFEMLTQAIYDLKTRFVAKDVLMHHVISLVSIDRRETGALSVDWGQLMKN